MDASRFSTMADNCEKVDLSSESFLQHWDISLELCEDNGEMCIHNESNDMQP